MKQWGYMAYVSEWAPIKEYAREGVTSESHDWIRCTPYPVGRLPAWGNIIFVPDEDADKFKVALYFYLRDLRHAQILNWIRNQIIRIPPIKNFYEHIRRLYW